MSGFWHSILMQVLDIGMQSAARWLELRDSSNGLQSCMTWRRCVPHLQPVLLEDLC